jgi:hypothetical protein
MRAIATRPREKDGGWVMVKARLLSAVGIMALVGSVAGVLTAQTPASPAVEVASIIAPEKAWEKGIEDEHMKPLNGIQLAKI